MLIPFETQKLEFWGLILLALGLLGLLMFVRRFFSKRRRRKRGEPVPRRGCLFGFIELLVLLLFATTGLLMLTLAGLQRTFKAFTDRQVVLQVHAQFVNAPRKQMQVELQWPEQSAAPRKQNFTIRGDQWEIEGNILVWDDFLTVYGFKPGYKLTRLRGRYLDTQAEKTLQPSVIPLANERQDWRWKWLLRFAPRLPGVRSAHGQTVFTYPNPDKVYKILISHDGFTLQEGNYAPGKF
ncbi:MAG: hypothetical protein D6814_17595 [Calditrichaeota bacterium]|nr:MAG: hypothetical protein D6814_17595 [Calditrichota bacterium]